jgi:hypothetical protein
MGGGVFIVLWGGRHESLCSANPMNTIPPAKRSNEEKQHITEAKRTKNPTMNYSKQSLQNQHQHWWRCVKTISLSSGAVNPVTLTKKTKEHNDCLIKTDDTQRHEDGSPNYNKEIIQIQMAQRHTTNSFMKLILKICSLNNHSLTKQRTSSVGLLG